MIGDAFAPGAALPDARLEKNVRGATSPLLAALDRAKIAVGATGAAAAHAQEVHDAEEHDTDATLAAFVAANGFRERAQSAYAKALKACYEAGVLALPVAAVEDAEAALAFALDEVAKRAQSKPNAMPGGRP